eukprot:jgi/Mesen1/849/ME000112S10997
MSLIKWLKRKIRKLGRTRANIVSLSAKASVDGHQNAKERSNRVGDAPDACDAEQEKTTCDLPKWTSLSDFKDMQELHIGSTSMVVSAKCVVTNWPVVVKIYVKKGLQRGGLKRIRQEIDCLQAFRHQHMVEMYRAFEDNEVIVLVFEHATKGDVYQQLTAVGSLSEATVVQQSENLLLVDAQGAVKLCDFGFAIRAEKERPTARLGTLDYMAPEVIRASGYGADAHADEPRVAGLRQGLVPSYDSKVDIWACGVLAYELLTGEPPFEVPDRADTCALILTKELPMGPCWPPHFSEHAISFLQATLQKDFRRRPAAAELLTHPWLCNNQLSARATPPLPSPAHSHEKLLKKPFLREPKPLAARSLGSGCEPSAGISIPPSTFSQQSDMGIQLAEFFSCHLLPALVCVDPPFTPNSPSSEKQTSKLTPLPETEAFGASLMALLFCILSAAGV